MTLHAHTLLHLISISFAVGLAYIALDRFRYTTIVRALYKNAYEVVSNPKIITNPAHADILKVKINDKLKKCEDGLGMKIFFNKWGPKTFGSDNSGWDMPVMYAFLSFNFVFLCIGSFIVNESYQMLYWFMFIAAVLGILSPVGFIYRGKKHIGYADKFIEDEVSILSKLYKISVNELQDKIKNHS